MKKLIYITLTLLCAVLALSLSGCDNPLQLETKPETLTAGETFELSFTYGGDPVPREKFYYASGDESVAFVDEYGKITACGEGTTTLYVQHKEDATVKTTVEVSVLYDVVDELQVTKTHRYEDIYEQGTEPLPFFRKNGYEFRGKKDSFWDIVKIVTGTHEDEYVFTELTRLVKTQDDALMVLSDWGNQDVALDANVLRTIDLSTHLVGDLSLSEDKFAREGESAAESAIKKTISEQMKALGYEIALSCLSDEYEYRVSIRIDYSAYRTKNYYSRGLVQGGLNAIITPDTSKFLDAYTYQKEVHEVVLDTCALVIEKRPKTANIQ